MEVYVDGGSRGNPGPAGAGVYFPGLLRLGEYLGPQTNNFAEYSALILALRVAVSRHANRLRVYCDSELVVRQIQGSYKVRNENIRPLYDTAKRWIDLIPEFSIEHVRREFNKDADELANLAMDKKGNLVDWE